VKRFSLCLVALAVLGFAGSACGSLAPYAAVVNGHRISQKSLDSELNAIKSNEIYRRAIESGQTRIVGSGEGTFDLAFVARVLTRDIYFQLVHQGVTQRKVKISDVQMGAARTSVIDRLQDERVLAAFPHSYQQTLIRRSAEVDALESSLKGPVDRDAEARTYFDAHTADFEKACVSHILVPTKQKADELAARLSKGEDFAEVAKAESKDPGTAQVGGDLGCFTRDAQLVPEFLQAAFAQPVGQVGAPVQTTFGFHLIKVSSRTAPTFDEAKADVQKKLRATSSPQLTEWLQKTLSKAKVKLNPKFGTFSTAGGSPSVVPPQAPAGLQGVPGAGTGGGIGGAGGAGGPGGVGAPSGP
jgi:foldase protein PrsA